MRAANARLRELLAGRDAEIAALRARVAQAEGLVADLREQVTELAARVGQRIFELLEAAVVGRAG